MKTEQIQELLEHAHAELLALTELDELGGLDLIECPQDFSSYHPNRQREFLGGRLAATRSLEKLTGQTFWSIPRSHDRSPHWPANVVGSISHTDQLALAVVAQKNKVLALGADLENCGRVKEKFKRMILSPEDIKEAEGLNPEMLLTLIFSAKESLYKALYPLVKKFFGFEYAALTSASLEKGTFEIKLVKDLSDDFGPSAHHLFKGRFLFTPQQICTVIELKSS